MANALNTKFVFKTSLDEHKIAKFIGAKGRNINELIESIKASDNSLTGEKVVVSICPDKKIRMQRLHFENLKTDVEDNSKVLVTVEMDSSDRDDSLKTVRNFVTKAVEKAGLNGYSNSSSGWGNDVDYEDVDPGEW
jgi:hypothetical protein